MKTLTFYPGGYSGSFQPNTIQNAIGDFEKYFESFFGDSILAPAARLFNQIPVVDIEENETSYVMEMELAGFDEKNIEVHVDGYNLTIASKQVEDEKCENKNYLLKERRKSSFSRSFKLPENADPEGVSASFKNGVLNLEIKKRAEAQKRVIQINAA